MDIDTDHKKTHGAEMTPPSGRTMNYRELSTQTENTTRGSQ